MLKIKSNKWNCKTLRRYIKIQGLQLLDHVPPSPLILFKNWIKTSGVIISWSRGYEELILQKYLYFGKTNYSRLLFLKALHRRCSTRFWVCLRFWIAQNFEHVLCSECVSILHVPELWISLWFWICQDSKYLGLGAVNLDITFWCFVVS